MRILAEYFGGTRLEPEVKAFGLAAPGINVGTTLFVALVCTVTLVFIVAFIYFRITDRRNR